MTAIGFNEPLYILPFDHRGSFQTKMFGWTGTLSPEQTAEIASTKQVIYDGFKAALHAGVPEQKAGILVDEQRSEEHTSELQSLAYLVCRLLLEKKKQNSILLIFYGRNSYTARITERMT